MTAYLHDKKTTQDIKQFLKPHTLNKITDKSKIAEKPKQKEVPVRKS